MDGGNTGCDDECMRQKKKSHYDIGLTVIITNHIVLKPVPNLQKALILTRLDCTMRLLAAFVGYFPTVTKCFLDLFFHIFILNVGCKSNSVQKATLWCG